MAEHANCIQQDLADATELCEHAISHMKDAHNSVNENDIEEVNRHRRAALNYIIQAGKLLEISFTPDANGKC